jgi:hypothetical protein
MNLLDAAGVVYMAFGAWRGRSRGLPLETFCFLRSAAAFLAGCGIYSLVGGAIRAVAGTLVPVSGLIGFAIGLGGAYYLLKLARRKTVEWLEPRVGPVWRKRGGAALGAARRLVVMLWIAVALHLTPSKEVQEQTTRGALIGRLAGVFAPDGGEGR